MRTFALFTLVLCALLVGCQTPPSDVVPTLAQLDQPTNTPESVAPTPTLQPTSAPLERPTLPPTWTPTDSPTAGPALSTLTPDPAFQALIDNPPPPQVCENFAADLARSTAEVTIGSPATVYWSAPPDAFIYEVALYDSRGFPRVIQRTNETSFTFEGTNFNEPRALWGWLVTPYNASNQPICLSRGGEIRTPN